jgi:hypothetical protein
VSALLQTFGPGLAFIAAGGLIQVCRMVCRWAGRVRRPPAHAAPRPLSRVIAAAGWVTGVCLAAAMWPTVICYLTYRAAKRQLGHRPRPATAWEET